MHHKPRHAGSWLLPVAHGDLGKWALNSSALSEVLQNPSMHGHAMFTTFLQAFVVIDLHIRHVLQVCILETRRQHCHMQTAQKAIHTILECDGQDLHMH